MSALPSPGCTGSRPFDGVTITEAGATVGVDCNALFSFIGAEPNSGWLGDVAVDEHGFVLTDRALDDASLGEVWDTLGRAPLPYETSRPGSVRGRRPTSRVDEARRCSGRGRIGIDPVDPRALVAHGDHLTDAR